MQRTAGDGCRYCNPQLVIDLLLEQIADDRANMATMRTGLNEAREKLGALL
jgi:hypothetical protein